MTRGTKETLVLETTPSGATATLDDGQSCTTPCALKVARRGDIVVTFTKDGFKPVETTVISSADGVAWGGPTLIGAVVGAGVDATTGAMHSHKPNPVRVTLELETPPEEERPAREPIR